MHADEIRMKRNAEADVVRKKEAQMKREAANQRIKHAQEQADAVLEAKRRQVTEKNQLAATRREERKIMEQKITQDKIQARVERNEVLAERLRAMHEEQTLRVRKAYFGRYSRFDRPLTIISCFQHRLLSALKYFF